MTLFVLPIVAVAIISGAAVWWGLSVLVEIYQNARDLIRTAN